MSAIASYFCSLIGLDPNPFTLQDIQEGLNKLHDVGAFRAFCVQNCNHKELNYVRGFARFQKLQELYLQAELAKREYEMEGEASELIHTTLSFFRKLDYHVRVENKDPRDPGVNKALMKYFSRYEMNILSKIGQREKLIQLAVNHPQALAEQIKQIMRDQALAMLTKQQAQAPALEDQTINKRVLTLLKPPA